jgi:hypothetical protein
MIAPQTDQTMALYETLMLIISNVVTDLVCCGTSAMLNLSIDVSHLPHFVGL